MEELQRRPGMLTLEGNWCYGAICWKTVRQQPCRPGCFDYILNPGDVGNKVMGKHLVWMTANSMPGTTLPCRVSVSMILDLWCGITWLFLRTKVYIALLPLWSFMGIDHSSAARGMFICAFPLLSSTTQQASVWRGKTWLLPDVSCSTTVPQNSMNEWINKRTKSHMEATDWLYLPSVKTHVCLFW